MAYIAYGFADNLYSCANTLTGDNFRVFNQRDRGTTERNILTAQVSGIGGAFDGWGTYNYPIQSVGYRTEGDIIHTSLNNAGDYLESMIYGDVARYARASAYTVEAETAIVIRDDFQGLGLGSQLFMILLSNAHAMGIRRIFGWVMSENGAMLRLFRKTNLPLRVESHSGEMLVQVTLGGE